MNKEIRVPALGESVTEATIAKWFKNVGDAVKADEPMVELETDKVTVEVPAPASGKLSAIAAASGSTVKVGALLGAIEEGAAGAAPKPAAPTPAPVAAKTAEPVKAEAPLSPAVRKLVTENKLEPASLAATGKDGRLTKGDVIEQLSRPAALPADLPAAAPAPAGGEERVKMSRLRLTIARRLKEAQNTAAMLTTFTEVDMSAVMALRNAFKDVFEKKHGVKLGFMSFFVKASIEALKAYPAVNAEIQGTDILYKRYYNIGVAVSGPKGLVVPVLRDADQYSFAGTEKAIADLGVKARDNKLTPEDFNDGTFTVSNGGIFGSMLSTPIINPPQVGILGMHNIVDRPVARAGQVVIRPIMYLALSYDHRIIDGREAVGFLVRIKETIEAPERMLLEV